MEKLTMEMADPVSEPLVSLPAMSNWAGDYNFNIVFSSEVQLIKKVECTYSSLLNKLYVRKDVPCSVNFSTEYDMPPGTVIRALAVFSLPDHANEVVRRCVTHSVSDISIGLQYPYHVVRCDSNPNFYEESPTGHLSVVVPFENPQTGEDYSTYIFKFVCWGSCTGGLNRRPITLVFTLENGGQVLGRQSVDVRICACPGRDRRSDEKDLETKPVQNSLPKMKSSAEQGYKVLDMMQFAKGIKFASSKKLKIQPHTPEGEYVIPVSSPEMYDFLKQMEIFYKICNNIRHIPPQLQNVALSSWPNRSNADKKSSDESN